MKVISKQSNSKDCLVCGIDNPLGVKASFYNMEDDSVICLFSFRSEHQSYPNRTHGGMIAAILDETIGRGIWVKEPTVWGVTLKLEVKYHKAVPYNEKLIAIARITKSTKLIFEGEAKLYDSSFNLLDTATALYYKLPLEEAANCDCDPKDLNIMVEDDVKEIALPDEGK